MKHTPGPWKVIEDSIGLSVMANRGDWICKPTGNTVGEEISNCSLIAAAPDLLSALVMAKNWMECDMDDNDMCEHDRAIYEDIMESINNAIKKATA